MPSPRPHKGPQPQRQAKPGLEQAASVKTIQRAIDEFFPGGQSGIVAKSLATLGGNFDHVRQALDATKAAGGKAQSRGAFCFGTLRKMISIAGKQPQPRTSERQAECAK